LPPQRRAADGCVRGAAQVYDATPFLKAHPGGGDSILIVAGTDATEEFNAIHSAKAKAQLLEYCIGDLADENVACELPPLWRGLCVYATGEPQQALFQARPASHSVHYEQGAMFLALACEFAEP